MSLLVCADLTELAIGQRLGKDASVNEAEGIPLGRAFGLEVPEYPGMMLAIAFAKWWTNA